MFVARSSGPPPAWRGRRLSAFTWASAASWRRTTVGVGLEDGGQGDRLAAQPGQGKRGQGGEGGSQAAARGT